MSLIESPAVALTPTHQHALEQLPPRVAEALLRFRDNLLARFPAEIRRIILYGSFARGEWHSESDIDVLVVVGWVMLRSPDGRHVYLASDPGRKEILGLAYEATLECGRFVSAFVIDEALYRESRDAVDVARREGVELYRDPSATESLQSENATTRRLKDSSPGDVYSIDPNELNDIREWLAMADEELQVVRDLLRDTRHRQAVSSAYYAMFYAAKAALPAANVTVKSHEGAISEFGRLFVSTGHVDGRLGAMLADRYEDWLDSDYSLWPNVTRELAQQAMQDAGTFIARARELVEEELSKRGAFPA